MVTTPTTSERQDAAKSGEPIFPDISADEKRALIESLDEAERQIARGDYAKFDPDALFSELKRKYSTLK